MLNIAQDLSQEQIFPIYMWAVLVHQMQAIMRNCRLIFGGGWDYTTLGRTTYTIANRGNLAINQTTIGGSSGNFFTIKAYANSNGNTDIYIVVTNVYPAFTINSVLLNNSAAEVQTITQYASAPSETDITPAVLPVMITDQNGNIGLNTANPNGYKLAVNGTMIATAVTVKPYNIWPDYVFNNDYKLPPLTEVKKFIRENHHLSEIPSANKIETDGQNLGEMNRLLTQKVEELTLYLIEKDTELRDQQVQIKELSKTVDSTKSYGDRIHRLEKLLLINQKINPL
jgi:hypothetical protein